MAKGKQRIATIDDFTELLQEQNLVGNKFVLSIGIEYQPPNKLDYTVSDARKFAQILRDTYGYFEITINDFTRNGLEDSFKALPELIRKTGETASLVVFFAGHGLVENGKGYWLTSDNRKLSLLEITTTLKACCKQVLLIVDCCYGGKATEFATYADMIPTTQEKSKLMVVTSGNNSKTVPDKSLFMESLEEILKIESIPNFEKLVAQLKEKAAEKASASTITSYSSNDQIDLTFCLKRQDQVAYELQQKFFELNFSDQTPKAKGARLFNLIYLNGTEECGHNIFTQRFFNELEVNNLTMFNHTPIKLSLGKEFQTGNYDLISQLANKLNLGANQSPTAIFELLIREIRAKHLLIILKVDNCDTGLLQTALENFWKLLIEFAKKLTLTDAIENQLYLFVWDRRGAASICKDTQLNEIGNHSNAKLFFMPPIKQISIEDDLKDWYEDAKRESKSLRDYSTFTNLKLEEIEDLSTIQTVICQIATQCNKIEVYDALFLENHNCWLS